MLTNVSINLYIKNIKYYCSVFKQRWQNKLKKLDGYYDRPQANDDNSEVASNYQNSDKKLLASCRAIQVPYQSDTDDEDKYITKKNVKFTKLKGKKKKAHIMALWRKMYVRLYCAAIMINQILLITQKISIFGR